MLVAAFLRKALVEETALAKPAQAAIADAPDDALEHVAGRRCEAVKANFAGIVRCEDAIGDDGVEMEIQVEAATEPLNVVDRRVLAAGDACSAPLLEGDRGDKDAAKRAGDIGAECGEVPQLGRQRPTLRGSPPKFIGGVENR